MATLEEWLEALSILPDTPKGRSQAAPLATGVSQGELGAATGAGRSVNAEYLGILTILESEPQARPASLIRRPRSRNVTPNLNCCKNKGINRKIAQILVA